MAAVVAAAVVVVVLLSGARVRACVRACVGEIGVVPRNATTGGLEWMWLGPVGDLQFPIALSRHAIFGPLVAAWNSTGNAVYSRLFDNITADWVQAVPPPADGSQDTHGLWMSLEPGIRMSASWPEVRTYVCHHHHHANSKHEQERFFCGVGWLVTVGGEPNLLFVFARQTHGR